MSFSLQLLIASAVLASFILLLLAKAKQNIINYVLLPCSILFFSAATWFLSLEYSGYQKRNKLDGAWEIDYMSQLPEKERFDKELRSLSSLRNYRNAWKGYEAFFMDFGKYEGMPFSYEQTMKDEIFSQMENEEYGESYWTRAFNLIFNYKDSIQDYRNLNYEAVFGIPSKNPNQEMEDDFGDLTIPENYQYFEKVSQLEYLGQKLRFLDRSPKHIAMLWKQNKTYFYTYFSKNRYDHLCKRVVDELISVHNEIVAAPFHREFYSMYDVSDEGFLDFPSRSFTENFMYSWPFSFWDRRFAENNDQEVYRILKEIQNHYQN
ncbi:hypothetical protein SYJ56_18790 [Algoriphagus sp. D3-2-R+10]|uniref:hypothetical protein n=1 Tax=Algoriphagus aurantiacus TaxID=3103948 RepID=UPI002B380870|nr:hypothetical protein [Algoriphagus sp. D3-2-R+10]MEB2777369.1 hypothetical protein [Algoriphagus sp. D3-2-R+10]